MRLHGAHAALAALAAATLAACGSTPVAPDGRSPEAVRARIMTLMPASVPDRAGWAVDIHAAFAALKIAPNDEHVCAVLAVIAQESTYCADPAVPRLGALAREEIDRRADRAGVPRLVVSAALQMRSPDTRTYAERIESARTERELSEVFDDFIGEVPLGRTLLAGWNPVRTGGPMQVGIAFAERHVKQHGYPYRMTGTVRDEVFTRRGGVYFGTAHLLGYDAPYERLVYRYADFNAGWYASRNAAFQSAVAKATGVALDLDGDLVSGDAAHPGETERAVRRLGPQLGLDDAGIRRALERGDDGGFERTRLWSRVFELAEAKGGSALPRAVLPQIRLQSPKITRPLTTEWFARRVETRQRDCMARADG